MRKNTILNKETCTAFILQICHTRRKFAAIASTEQIKPKTIHRLVSLTYGYKGSSDKEFNDIEKNLQNAIGKTKSMKVEGNLTSCSRTDKEVHALSNVATFFASVEENKAKDTKELVSEINKSLGKESNSRVFSLRILENGEKFNARSDVLKRTYRYFVPERYLTRTMHIKTNKNINIQFLNEILQPFVTSQNFHNFYGASSGLLDRERDNSESEQGHLYRTIHSFECIGRTEIGDKRFLILEVTGRSFVYQQIRRMVGMALSVYKGLIPGSLLPIAVETPIKVKTPLALPGLLYLHSVDVGEPHKKYIELSEQEQYNMKTFLERNLLPYIRETLKLVDLEKYEKDVVIPMLRSNHMPSIMTQYEAWKQNQKNQKNEIKEPSNLSI